MPKKTKKEKISASLHKQHMANNSHIHITYADKPSTDIIPEKRQMNSNSRSTDKPIFDANELEKSTQNFKTDLHKSLGLVFVILALELGLYYASMQGLLKFM